MSKRLAAVQRHAARYGMTVHLSDGRYVLYSCGVDGPDCDGDLATLTEDHFRRHYLIHVGDLRSVAYQLGVEGAYR